MLTFELDALSTLALALLLLGLGAQLKNVATGCVTCVYLHR
jgi:hypothetical protein